MKGGNMHQTTTDIWTVRDTTLATSFKPDTLVGYEVEATDGSIGKIDDTTLDAGSGTFIVDTGPWIFGKKVMLPIGIVRSADHDEQKVFVNRTKDEIKNAPEFDESLIGDETYRNQLGSYYGPGGVGWREWD
jgi:PRC-barrel domain